MKTISQAQFLLFSLLLAIAGFGAGTIAKNQLLFWVFVGLFVAFGGVFLFRIFRIRSQKVTLTKIRDFSEEEKYLALQPLEKDKPATFYSLFFFGLSILSIILFIFSFFLPNYIKDSVLGAVIGWLFILSIIGSLIAAIYNLLRWDRRRSTILGLEKGVVRLEGKAHKVGQSLWVGKYSFSIHENDPVARIFHEIKEDELYFVEFRLGNMKVENVGKI